MKNLLDSIEKKISIKCASLDLEWGHHCSFLYSPESTFSKETDFWFVGLNPGSNQEARSKKCLFSAAPNTNSYYSEGWNGERCENTGQGEMRKCEQYPYCEHGMNKLQREVTWFFKRLAKTINPRSSQDQFVPLMDKTLTANYFPFASSGWEDAVEQMRIRPEIELTFAEEIWEEILQEFHPSAMVVMSNIAVKGFFQVFNNRLGWEQKGLTINIDTKWFNKRRLYFTVTKFVRGDKETSLIGIPHLSRFGVFSTEKCKEPSKIILKKVTDLIGEQHCQTLR